MCLNETCTRVQQANIYQTRCLLRIVWKKDLLQSLFFYFALEHTIRRDQQTRRDRYLMAHISFWYTLVMLVYWVKTYILQRKTQKLYQSLVRRLVQKVMLRKLSKCMFMCQDQDEGQYQNIKIGNKLFKTVKHIKYLDKNCETYQIFGQKL